MGRRGNKKHLKRLAAPKHWMLDKLSGVWAPRPTTGPHKLRECLPLILILRNRLKYAITAREVQMILMQKSVKVDGKIRLNPRYPCGFMDVVTIELIDSRFRLLYDTKGRYTLVKIDQKQAQFKLCRVTAIRVGRGGVPQMTTHDGRTVRYPDPEIKVGDSIKLNIAKGTAEEYYKMAVDSRCMIVKGRNAGRVGTIRKIEKHVGAIDLAHIVDDHGHNFATRSKNVFIIGEKEAEVKLPAGDGVKLGVLEEREQRAKRAKRNN
eukprot:UN28890